MRANCMKAMHVNRIETDAHYGMEAEAYLYRNITMVPKDHNFMQKKRVHSRKCIKLCNSGRGY